MNIEQSTLDMPNNRKLLTQEEFRTIVSSGPAAVVAALSQYVRTPGGRKPTGEAMTGKERVRLYRQRKREEEERELERARSKGKRKGGRKE